MSEISLIEITHHALGVLFVFLIGYTAIVIEEVIKLNKAATALLMAIGCWILLFAESAESVDRHLTIFIYQMFKVSQVLFFLLGALTIVEIISAHNGFKIITENLVLRSKRVMLWAVGIVTFFLSSVLDNLTTTVVMVSLIAKIIDEKEERWLLGGLIVIAANAGGAWTPIGDVATTLLWIYERVSTKAVLKDLFIPSILGLFAALVWFSFIFKGEFPKKEIALEKSEKGSTAVLVVGISSLIFVPFFKILTDLPPFMGMMFGLGVMWLITDLMHYRYKERDHLRVPAILPNVNISVIFFYLGILLSINALETAGLLKNMAIQLEQLNTTPLVIPVLVGLVSSVVDNVSLVAAMIGMYDLSHFPLDSPFWLAAAYCAGTGGSIFILGSAAGIALMAKEGVDFMWYTKKITLPALLTYFVGIMVYILLALI